MFDAYPLQRRCVEPVKRMCAGRYGWVVHRFPIKGGLPLFVLWAEEAARWSKALAQELRRESHLHGLVGLDSVLTPGGLVVDGER